jgi:hypothetical protein
MAKSTPIIIAAIIGFILLLILACVLIARKERALANKGYIQVPLKSPQEE